MNGLIYMYIDGLKCGQAVKCIIDIGTELHTYAYRYNIYMCTHKVHPNYRNRTSQVHEDTSNLGFI